MGRRIIIALAIVVSCLMGLAVIARLTGLVNYYVAPSESNAPAFYPGARFFASTLKKPSRFDFITYRRADPQLGAAIWFHRVIGMAGDRVEIRNGEAFVNGAPADDGLNLMQEYIVSNKAAQGLDESLTNNDKLSHSYREYATDSTIYYWTGKVVTEKHIPAKRYIFPVGFTDSMIQVQYGQPWNVDQFGPVQVPEGHYFLLGDNRHNSMDSRYIGLISEQDFAGTVLGKH